MRTERCIAWPNASVNTSSQLTARRARRKPISSTSRSRIANATHCSQPCARSSSPPCLTGKPSRSPRGCIRSTTPTARCVSRRSTQARCCGDSRAMFKPPLKWAGGKRWLVPHLKPIWEENSHRRYVEPFCGGLAVVLGLQPKKALLNDINPHLINFYRQLRDGLYMNIEMRNEEKLFYRHRER